ncbi:esterase/lipase superfamily enzyme [Pseudomonas sp. 3296]|uniref:alpha/beta hydrolase n=1 Tax=Pseudomonas sp. 3296 TaxID=2817753 RepID=UPI00285737BF|nr:alpha/beta hydrolase [Pseudomonas sp. 3296]MDR6915085.1 esterase/lipase superfamily enzyme [Pseudomonas sp. 3296]
MKLKKLFKRLWLLKSLRIATIIAVTISMAVSVMISIPSVVEFLAPPMLIPSVASTPTPTPTPTSPPIPKPLSIPEPKSSIGKKSNSSIVTDSRYIIFNDSTKRFGTPTDKWSVDSGKIENTTALKNEKPYNTYAIRPKLDFSTIDVVSRTDSPVTNTLQQWQDPREVDTSGYHGVRVNFATDRQYTTNDNNITFTSEPGRLSYGYCYVSIPPHHKTGAIESPSILRLEFDEDPQKHVMILKTELLSHDMFTRDIGWLAQVSKSGSAFVFIHGFNVGFDDAAKRTAQMAYDLNFDGVPIFYSWPSRNSASLTAYEADERNIELSEGKIKDFLVEILSDARFSNVFVVGHSMGTRGLAKAIGAIAVEKPEVIGKLKAIVLAAPDIDAELFKQQIAPRLLKAERNITLYASSNDKALVASQKLHGYPRAGDSGSGLVILKGMDTIDASNVDTSLLGHSYYGDVRSIIDDMHYIIQESLPVNKRAGLSPTGSAPNKYWLFKP